MPGPTDLRAQRDYLEQAIQSPQRRLGADHPDLANDLPGLGRLSQERGDMTVIMAASVRTSLAISVA